METSTKFSNTELILFISNIVISKLFLVYPSSFAALGASATIMLAVLTAITGLIFTIITLCLYKKKVDILSLVGSKIIRTVFALLFITVFIVNQGYFVRSVAESLKISILPRSPLFFTTLIYMTGVIICSRTGLKAIVRAHSFVTPFTIALVILLLASSINNFDFYNVFPVMGKGSIMFSYLGILASYFADFVLLMFIMPFSSDKASYKKIIIISHIISSAMLIIIMGIYTLTIPYSVSGTFFIPVYRIAQYINYQSFMARMESLFTIGWMLSYFLTSATYLYITSMLAGRIFKAKSYRPCMYVIAVIIFIISFIPKNTDQLIEWSNFIATPRLVVNMILPVLILLWARFKEGRER